MAYIFIPDRLSQFDLHWQDPAILRLKNHVNFMVSPLCTHMKDLSFTGLGVYPHRQDRQMFEERTEQSPFS